MATELGFSVGGSLVGGIVVGLFLDQRLGTRPLFFLLGLVGGVFASFYLIYVIYRMQVQPARQTPSPPSPGVSGPPPTADGAGPRGASQSQDADSR